MILLEQVSELRRDRRVKLHALASYRMGEAKHIGMQTETVQGVVAIAIFHVTTHRVPHIGRVYTLSLIHI